MSYNVVSTHRFERELKRLSKKHPSLKHEFAKLIDDILTNPVMGIFIGNHCYKIRIGINSKGRGKSGGARVISYLYINRETIKGIETNLPAIEQIHTVYLLTIYDKSEKTDLKFHEIKEMVESLELDTD